MKLNWQHKRDKLKLKFNFLTGRDLKYTVGKEKQMLEKLGEKLGKTDKELLKVIIDL